MADSCAYRLFDAAFEVDVQSETTADLTEKQLF